MRQRGLCAACYGNHRALTPATARAGEAAAGFGGVLPWGGYGGAKPSHAWGGPRGGHPPGGDTVPSVTRGSGGRSLVSGCNNIGFVTVSLATSESAPETAEADVLVIGVIQTPDGPAAAPGLAGVDEALGGTLADTLAALGATGELEELTKIPGGGKLPATLVLAVGLGGAAGGRHRLRRRRSSAGPPERRYGRPRRRRRARVTTAPGRVRLSPWRCPRSPRLRRKPSPPGRCSAPTASASTARHKPPTWRSPCSPATATPTRCGAAR